MICSKCNTDLPEHKFSLRETGERRKICNNCRYIYGGKQQSYNSRLKNPVKYKLIRLKSEVKAINNRATWLQVKPNKTNEDVFTLLQLRLKILLKTIKNYENI